MIDLKTLWAANSNRWHHNANRALRNCGDDNDAHQGRCVRLYWALFPDATAHELAAMAMHDVAEVVSGDPSGQAKNEWPLIRQAHDHAEAHTNSQWGIPMPRTQWEIDRQSLVDKLDAYLMMRDVAPHLHTAPDWMASLNAIMDLSRKLNVFDQVSEATKW